MHEPEIEVSKTLTYIEELVEILDKKVKKLRNKKIPIVKVKWSYHSPKEATWEVEDQIRQKYPHLFLGSGNGEYLNFEDEIFIRRGEL